MEHPFTTYVRTKTVFQHRLKDLKEYDSVKIYMYELAKLNVTGPLLYALKQEGQIWYDQDGNFKVLKEGSIDLKVLEKTKRWQKVKGKESDLHVYMKKILMYVTISVDIDKLPVYFRAFLEHREESLDLFFTVDSFSGRVHTPVVNLKGEFRSKLLLNGESLCSLDVKQMQPLILAKALFLNVGDNPFSKAILNGEDAYLLLLRQNPELTSREDAKKFLYRLIFGYPMADIGKMFKGDTKWVDWINYFKSISEPKNPHTRDMHTNLAWLLQSKEVEIMTGVWQQLMERQILFLSIHDEILVQIKDKEEVRKILSQELEKHFDTFEITNH